MISDQTLAMDNKDFKGFHLVFFLGQILFQNLSLDSFFFQKT
jgi:hypothetical protein